MLKKPNRLSSKKGGKCLCIAGDLGQEDFCKQIAEQTVTQFGKLDILVNNAAEQHVQNSLESIISEQMERTFRTNFFGIFFNEGRPSPYEKGKQRYQCRLPHCL